MKKQVSNAFANQDVCRECSKAQAEEKAITLQVEPFEDRRLWHDPGWTAEALGNLLDNAVKYRREDEPLNIRIETKNISEDNLEISIADNGIGIRKEDLKKIFEKFYRVSTGNRHDVKGFGLGLAYVQKLVREMHGDITVESEINKGTKFKLILPLTKN